MELGLVDDIITRLLDLRYGPGKHIPLLETEIRQLCWLSRKIFLEQPMLLELEAPLKICGDIHGQYSDLLRIFDIGGYPPSVDYLFLGDYVDRGEQGLETICLLLAYKIKYPNNFFLLRGNHECESMNIKYGFYDECERRFNVGLYETFRDCFECLPVAAIVDEQIFCVHGGISKLLDNLDQIREIPRPAVEQESGLLSDLLWSDPSKDNQGWNDNYLRGRDKCTFGTDQVTEFLQKHDLGLICRAHSVVDDGYEYFAGRELVTIFSAPNYRRNNAGAILTVSDNLICSFQILEPSDDKFSSSRF